MKNIIKNTILAIALILFSSLSVYAADPILYWGTTCPHCHALMEKMAENDIYSKINVVELEVYENNDNKQDLLKKAKECKLESVGIPLLYFNGHCYSGEEDVYNELVALIDNGYVSGQDDDEKEEKVIDEVGKRNTEKLMIGVLFFLVLLPLVGVLIENGKIKKEEEVIEQVISENNISKKNKNKKKKKRKMRVFSVIAMFVLIQVVSVAKTYAFCPVCTIAIGAGVGLTRYLKIDDTIPGVWAGGLCISLVYWLISFIEKRRKKLPQRDRKAPLWMKILSFIGVYALVIIPLYFTKMIGVSNLWGIDKIILGMIVGTIFALLGDRVEKSVRKRNKGKAVFPFQKVVIPVFFLLLATFIFYMVIYY
ncbi:hypothetical protein J6Z48_03160 [bacterium]|nr:hypothetical protein [bacterium]